MHLFELFLPDPNNDPDMNLADIEAEIEAGFDRQQLISDWLNGKEPLEKVMDLFADDGIDSNEWEDVVCDVVDRVIANGTIIEDMDLIRNDMARIKMGCL
jgi:hypothetical protein